MKKIKKKNYNKYMRCPYCTKIVMISNKKHFKDCKRAFNVYMEMLTEKE